jgi:putative phosphoesterase
VRGQQAEAAERPPAAHGSDDARHRPQHALPPAQGDAVTSGEGHGLTVGDARAGDGLVVGLISDTHGLLRPEALEALHGADLIIHAGDVGREGILGTLAQLAPVQAVRGNVDRGVWAEKLRRDARVEVGEVKLYVYHGHEALELDPVAAGCQVVVSGHSHKPAVEARGGVLYLNPGSAGPRRFKLPVTVMRLYIKGGELKAELIELG